MSPEADHRPWLLRGFFGLLALLVPTLVGYVVYDQLRAPVCDAVLDWQTGVVLEVPFDSLADYAGFHPGDVILAVDGLPFAEWRYRARLGNYAAVLERDGRRLTRELPLVPLAKVNFAALASAVIVALTWWGCSLLLLLRRSRQKEIHLIFISSQMLAITLLFPIAYALHHWNMPVWGLRLSVACLYLSAPLILHHYLTFPVNLVTSRRRRWRLGLLYGLMPVAFAGWLSGDFVAGRLSILYPTLVIATAIAMAIYVYSRRATPDGRRRLRLVFMGTLLAGMPPLLFFLIPSILSSPHRMPLWLTGLCTIVAPLCYLYATLRHNLFGIDRLLNRTLVYAILSLGILSLYLGPFLLIYRLAPGDLLAQMMVAAGLTLLVGLAFERSRTLVQRLVDRLFYGGWYDYPGVIETVSDALARSLQREQVRAVLTRQVPALMQLHQGQLWIGGPGATSPAQAQGPHLQFSFALQGQHRGVWTVGPHRDGEDFNDGDRRILATLARQAEIALNNVLLVETLRRQLEEIRAIQRQLLRSREEERSRLARDLHDGPIQILVGLSLQLGLLLTPENGENSSSSQALQAIRAEVRELLADLRQVCAELRPPMLDTLGLGAALHALAADWSAQCGVPVRLDLPADATLRSLPDEVSVNLYRVVQEALSNVARHAAAQEVTLRLAWQGPRLCLTIQDDGQGFVVPPAFQDLATQNHFGLVGMQERAELIGGCMTIESAPGQGATVHVITEELVE